jgi:exonuclease III
MDSTPPSNDTVCQVFLFKPVCQSVVYKRPTLLPETNTVLGWKKIYQPNSLWKQAGIAILISDKTEFKLKLLKRNKEGHFILIKGAIHQEEITITNLYAPNVSAPNFIKHTLKDLKAHIDPNTVVVGDFI